MSNSSWCAMLRWVPAILIAIFSCSRPAAGQDIQSLLQDKVDLPSMLQSLLPLQTPNQTSHARASAKASVANKSILGPTGELLPPVLATQRLRGKDYFEWCLRWNKQQYLEASRRAVPGTTIRGQSTRQASFVQGANSSGFWGRRGNSYNVLSNSANDSREQVWQVGGHGGGPVELYNPFVSR